MIVAQRDYVARNSASTSDNPIHSSERVARDHGFAGGLVPGLTAYAFVADLLVEDSALGLDWLDSGSLSLRYLAPIYDGEELTVLIEDTGDDGTVDVCVVGFGGTHRVRGSARAVSRCSPPATPLPEVLAPRERFPLNAEGLLDAEWLASVELTPSLAEAQEYFASVGLPVERAGIGDCAAPGYLARTYRESVARTFARLEPSVHTASDVRHHRRVRYGESLSLRGRVDRLFARRGHRYVCTDFVWYDTADVAVMSARQSRIYHLRAQ